VDASATAERLVRDHFPTECLLPDGSPVKEARVFVTSERVIVWTRGEGFRPRVAYSAPLTTQVERDRGSLRTTLVVETEDGRLYVNKARGCGCGSVLKALGPPVAW
jgi:hypothetical protein